MAPRGGGGLQVGCGDLIWLPLSLHVCLGLVVECWSFVGACACPGCPGRYCLCLLSSLFGLLPLPRAPPTHLLIHTGPILMKNYKKLVKISHHLLVRLVVQKLIDIYISLGTIVPNSRDRQGKLWLPKKQKTALKTTLQ